jgi:polyisoprenyl-phosphate glycosyltransferase
VQLKTLDIICPVYNEAEVIRDFYQELKSQLELLKGKFTYRMIFVLDQGTDDTENILKGISEKDSSVSVICLSARFGHQMSLVAGMDHSNADYCIMMDCDLEHPPVVIHRLLEKAEEGYDIVYTVRRYSDQVSFFKKWTSSFYYRFINTMTDLSLDDGAADFRLIAGKVRDVFKFSIREQNQFIRGLISWVGFRSTAIQYQSQARRAGVSKYRVSRLIKFATVGIISFSKKPLRMATYLGFFVSAISLFIFIYHIYIWFRHSDLPPGWTTLALLISFIGSAQLFFLGILGEYLAFIFDETKNRPLYVVNKKFNA